MKKIISILILVLMLATVLTPVFAAYPFSIPCNTIGCNFGTMNPTGKYQWDAKGQYQEYRCIVNSSHTTWVKGN